MPVVSPTTQCSTRSSGWGASTASLSIRTGARRSCRRRKRMLVLDTDLLTIVQRKAGDVYQRLDDRLQAAAPTQRILVTMISFEEQMRGWLAFLARARNVPRQIDAYKRLHELFEDFQIRQILDFDDQAAAKYQRLVKDRIRIGT